MEQGALTSVYTAVAREPSQRLRMPRGRWNQWTRKWREQANNADNDSCRGNVSV